MSTSDETLSVTPLGAGDLIDRAVRFYRGNFRTFLLIAAPPVVLGTLVSLGWRVLGRELFYVSSRINASDQFFYYAFVWFGSIVIWFTELVATLVVMGGASRNFVRHLLFGEAITFSATYKNAKSRIGGLIVGSSFIVFILGFAGIFIFYVGLFLAAMAIMLVVWALSAIPILAFLVSLALGIGAAGGTLWLFFLLASRFAYAPQVMLVEGQGAFSAIGRSATLASGNVKRLMALFLFTTVATYSALALLYVPLLWYAWLNGIEIIGNNSDLMPVWFEVALQMVWQASFILISPVWMVGLCLLYIDERVRHEGYDIELAAARRLGDIPDVPSDYINPLQPALSNISIPQPASRPREDSRFTTLGLG
jgi:hypothetical protein